MLTSCRGAVNFAKREETVPLRLQVGFFALRVPRRCTHEPVAVRWFIRC